MNGLKEIEIIQKKIWSTELAINKKTTQFIPYCLLGLTTETSEALKADIKTYLRLCEEYRKELVRLQKDNDEGNDSSKKS